MAQAVSISSKTLSTAPLLYRFDFAPRVQVVDTYQSYMFDVNNFLIKMHENADHEAVCCGRNLRVSDLWILARKITSGYLFERHLSIVIGIDGL